MTLTPWFRTLLLTLLATALSSPPVLASPKPTKEEVEKHRQEMQKEATHVVTGRVKRVYETMEKIPGTIVVTLQLIIELDVSKVEKGEGLSPGPMFFQHQQQFWGGGGQGGGERDWEVVLLQNAELRVFAKRGQQGMFRFLLVDNVKRVEKFKPIPPAADAKEKDEKAREAAEAFIAALKTKELGEVVSVCDCPFWWDGKDVVDWSEFIVRFGEALEAKNLADVPYMVEEVLTYPNLPKPLLRDDDRQSLSGVLNDYDRIVVISMKGEKLAVLVHWKNDTATVVGFRD